MVESFESAVQKANEWFKDVKRELGYESDSDAYGALRAVLHTLRDRLPTNEMAEFGAQLPLLFKGVYYDGWRPAEQPLKLDADSFLALVQERFGKEDDPARITEAVMQVIVRHTHSEPKNLEAVLPGRLAALVHDAAEREAGRA
jgi:uncharacterized protein (DUF2267 family)